MPNKTTTKDTKPPAKKAPAKDKPAIKKSTHDNKKSSDSNTGVKRGRGHPPNSPDVWTDARKAEVIKALKAYVEKTAVPSVAEFCYKNKVRKQRLYEFEEFQFWREMLTLKKEAAYEKLGRSLTRDHGSRGNFINLALAQLGWTKNPDKQDDDDAKIKALIAIAEKLTGAKNA